MRLVVLVLGAILALAACASDDGAAPNGSSAGSTSTSSTGASTTPPVARTPQLDAIAVIGHSGATGYNSTGTPSDVPANSWATGTNPRVASVYQRLLRTHPELKGSAYNAAVSGSDSNGLMSQAESLLEHDPVPDIVFIQSIDNDLQCDGGDAQNLPAFESRVSDVVTFLQQSIPGVKVYFNDQPVDVHAYDVVLAQRPGGLAHLETGDECDVVKGGELDAAGEARLQELVDQYFDRLVNICESVPDCATDGGALQDIAVTDADISVDMNHFTVSGLAKVAAVVWDTLPAAWR